MHLQSLKKTRKDVSLHDPIGTERKATRFEYRIMIMNQLDEYPDGART